jgi:hypothetical protein
LIEKEGKMLLFVPPFLLHNFGKVSKHAYDYEVGISKCDAA